MKINMDNETPLTTLDGQNIKSEEGKLVTLRSACVRALLYTDNTMDGPKKFECYELAKRIGASEEQVELTAEEITLIKKMVGSCYITILVGRIYELIEKAEG